MMSYFYYDQNPLEFCFLVQIRAFVYWSTKFKGPLPTLMQRSHLFLFWNRAFVNGALWLVNTFARLSRKKSHRRCVFPHQTNGCTCSSAAKSVNKYYFSWKWMSPLTLQVCLKETCTTPWDAEVHVKSTLSPGPSCLKVDYRLTQQG